MANLITYPERALTVIASDFANVPNPYVIVGGNNTAFSGNNFTDTAYDFGEIVNVGDVVYNISITASATVLSVKGDTIVLNAAVFTGNNQQYIIYQNSSISGNPNQGCLIYRGGAGSVTVRTAGGDEIEFLGPAGVVLPVKVVQVLKKGLTATGLIALF